MRLKLLDQIKLKKVKSIDKINLKNKLKIK